VNASTNRNLVELTGELQKVCEEGARKLAASVLAAPAPESMTPYKKRQFAFATSLAREILDELEPVGVARLESQVRLAAAQRNIEAMESGELPPDQPSIAAVLQLIDRAKWWAFIADHEELGFV
jgi:hypothetical protein